MLILSRKASESIVIGDGIVITVLRIGRDSVKLGIKAPAECRVHREEVQGLNEQEKAALKAVEDALRTGRKTTDK